MSDDSEASSKLPFFNLSYCVWLPGGKDEFGFDRFNDAPLNPTAFYRRTSLTERTISGHFKGMAKRLRGDNMLAFMDTVDDLRPMDGELGLRKIHFGFTYHHNYADLDAHLRAGPIEGTAVFLSNGMYLWSFRMPVTRPIEGKLTSELEEVFKGFLRDDFINRHMRRLFDFDWNPNRTQESPGYNGILTYYQLDLLFNGVFDQSAHPHLALGERSSTEDGRLEEKAREAYDVQGLIESFSLCVFGKEYVPLFDHRKRYTLRRTHGDAKAYIDTSLNLAKRTLHTDQEEAQHRREIFLSRLSFAAMEQFLRVSISFGLVHYKTGLDHVRAELISQGMLRRRNRGSGELRRPSLTTRSLMLADIESYYALLTGKVPVLSFLCDLVEGLSQASRPTKDPELSGVTYEDDDGEPGSDVALSGEASASRRRGRRNGVEGAVEWKFSRDTLDEAQSQFRRQIDAINTNIAAIDSSLGAIRNDLMLMELTEARKLSEIAAETPRSEVNPVATTAVAAVPLAPLTIDSELERRLTLRLTVLAAVIALLELFTGLGLWFIEKAFTGPMDLTQRDHQLTLAYWIVFPLIMIGGTYLGRRRLGLTKTPATEEPKASEESAQPEEDGPPGGEKLETHVFDYSSLSQQVMAGSAGLVDSIRDSMVDIEDPSKDRVACARFSTFHEVPSGGLERIKYSLESPETENRLTYVLHVEFDRRLSAKNDERLLDVRLVVRRPVTAPQLDILRNSQQVLGDAVSKLLKETRMKEADTRQYFLQHFGWPWPDAPSGSA